MTECYVQIAKESDMTGDEFPEDEATTFSGTVSDISDTVDEACTNMVTVTGLSEDTEYVYRLGDNSNEEWSEYYTIKTGSSDGYSFLFVADPQIGSDEASSDGEGWDTTITTGAGIFVDASLIVSGGDLVNTASYESEYDYYFDPDELKSLPVATVPGNHDNDVNYTYHFNMPNEITEYVSSDAGGDYYFTYGNTLFMMLNSNVDSNAAHQYFMEEAIEANPDVTWRVVVFHHSIYSAGSHSTDDSIVELRATLYPVFDELDIDVALMGHDHSYSRTYQMYGDQIVTDIEYDDDGNPVDPEGTVYITGNSASGSKYYDLEETVESYSAVRSQLYVPYFTDVSVDANSFEITTYRADTMAEIDTYKIIKTSSSENEIISTSIGELDSDGNLIEIPTETTVAELESGIEVSARSALTILEESSGSSAEDTAEVTANMVAEVTAEDGTEVEYTNR